MGTKKNHFLFSLIAGGLTGLALVILEFLLLGLLPKGSVIRNTVSVFFFFIDSPAMALGEKLFGQDPIPVFIILWLYWILLGALVSFLIQTIKYYFFDKS